MKDEHNSVTIYHIGIKSERKEDDEDVIIVTCVVFR